MMLLHTMRCARAAAALAMVTYAQGAGRQAVDFGGSCAGDALEVWSSTGARPDGSSSLQLAYNRACLGMQPLGTDACDGAPPRVWAGQHSRGALASAATAACVSAPTGGAPAQSACGRIAALPSVPMTGAGAAASASSDTAEGPAWRAFDGAGAVPWCSGQGYAPDGTPSGAPTTVVSGVPTAGHWVQLALPAPAVVTSYALLFDNAPSPAARGRPVNHVLAGAPSRDGPWSAVGRTDAGAAVLGIASHEFRTDAMQAFAWYRLIVTRVHRMGDGTARLGELRLNSDQQRLALLAPEYAATPLVDWRVSAVDAWAGAALPAVYTQAQGKAEAAAAASRGDYAGAVAYLDALNGATTTALSWTALTGGAIPAQLPWLGSGIPTGAALSVAFVAATTFSQSLNVTGSGDAALFVYDIAAGVAVRAQNRAPPVQMTMVAGRAYHALLVFAGAPSLSAILLPPSPRVHAATLMRTASPPSSPPSPATAAPSAVGVACGTPAFRLF